LRGAIQYRAWGQKDPLVEYKQEAYSMFVELMNDLQHTFTERFLKVQIVFEQPPAPPPPVAAPTRRFNAMGVAEDVRPEAPAAVEETTPAPEPVTMAPVVIGAGRPRTLDGGIGGTAVGALPPGTDLSKIGRNDVCPCGSGKKFKKCHGATG
jgi:preprotein translocase subunit SecA